MGDREKTTVRREMGERRTEVVVIRSPSLPGPFPSWIKDDFEAYDRCRREQNPESGSLSISGCSVSSGRSWSWAQRLEDTLIGRGIDIHTFPVFPSYLRIYSRRCLWTSHSREFRIWPEFAKRTETTRNTDVRNSD